MEAKFEVGDVVIVKINDQIMYGPAKVKLIAGLVENPMSGSCYYYTISDGKTTYNVAEYEIELEENYVKRKTLRESTKKWLS